MLESNFIFVKNEILRQNLDEAFNHIITLLPFTESTNYKEPAKSAFRKTIIIYTASIIEALLFYLLDKKFTNLELVEFYSSWQLKEKQILYIIDDSYEIVAGKYIKVMGKSEKEKMNLAQITDFLKSKKMINEELCQQVNQMRKLRNEQHLSTHTIVKSYTKSDLEKAFSVAHNVKSFVQENIK